MKRVILLQTSKKTGPEVKKKIMLNSAEHEVFPANKC